MSCYCPSFGALTENWLQVLILQSEPAALTSHGARQTPKVANIKTLLDHLDSTSERHLCSSVSNSSVTFGCTLRKLCFSPGSAWRSERKMASSPVSGLLPSGVASCTTPFTTSFHLPLRKASCRPSAQATNSC